MLKLHFYYLQIVPKIHTFGNNDDGKSFGEQAKPTNNLICFLLFCVITKISNANCQN